MNPPVGNSGDRPILQQIVADSSVMNVDQGTSPKTVGPLFRPVSVARRGAGATVHSSAAGGLSRSLGPKLA